jgi:hypothetical protein
VSIVKVLLALLILWVVLGVIGLIIKGLFWLFILGCIAFAVTGVLGAAQRRGLTGRR